MPVSADRLLIYDAYRATVAAGIANNATVVEVDVVPDLLNDATAGDVAVPVTVLDADGDLYANTVITGWSQADSEVYIPAFDRLTLAGPCTLICAPNRATMALVQLGQSVEGGSLGATSYDAEVGLTHHISVTAPGTINLIGAPDHGNFATTELTDKGQLTRLILLDVDADQPAVTVAGTIEWQDGTAPTFTVGRDMLLVELLQVQWGYIGWFRRFLAPVDPG